MNICCEEKVDLMYLCRAKNVDTTPQKDEIDDIGWFSTEEAMKLDTYEDIIKTIEAAICLLR